MKWAIEIELDDTGDLYSLPSDVEDELTKILDDHFEIVSVNAEPILED